MISWEFVRRGALAIMGLAAAWGAGTRLWAVDPPPQGEDRYESPEAILRNFTAELARQVKGQRGFPRPAQLAAQMATAKQARFDVRPDPGKDLSAEEIYARTRPSVVAVGEITRCQRGRHWHTGFATGFVIHSDGVIVTNAHVLTAFQRADAVAVLTDDGRVFPVRAVLAADTHNDVAVLQIDARNLPALPMARSVGVGATVYCLSHPALNCEGTQNGFYTLTKGIVAGKFNMRWEGQSPVNVVAITADYAQGSSGGPILNEHGAVVGIVCQTRSLCATPDTEETQMTWKFARPSSSVLALVDQASPGPKTAPSSSQ